MAYRWVAAALAVLVGIEPAEVMQVLSAEHRLPIPGNAGGFPVVAVLARTHTGRPLLVLIRTDPRGFDNLIVGARDATPEETAMLDSWEGDQTDD